MKVIFCFIIAVIAMSACENEFDVIDQDVKTYARRKNANVVEYTRPRMEPDTVGLVEWEPLDTTVIKSLRTKAILSFSFHCDGGFTNALAPTMKCDTICGRVYNFKMENNGCVLGNNGKIYCEYSWFEGKDSTRDQTLKLYDYFVIQLKRKRF